MRVLVALLITLATTTAGRAETITANLSFTDFDESPTPIASATVEVWRYAPRPPFGWFSWGLDRTAFTNSAGSLTVTVPFVGNGVVTSLRVYATNPAAVVKFKDSIGEPFYAQAGVAQVTTSPFQTLDFTWNATTSFDRNHFNVASAALTAFTYASARRDPRESDPIGAITYELQTDDGFNTYYDSNLRKVRLGSNYAMDDFTVIHEYAHHLEAQISSFTGVATYHNGCSFLSGPGGVQIGNAGLAWMEGFADYFAQAVAGANRSGATRVTGTSSGSRSYDRIESPSCPAAPLPPSATEDFVAGALLDLVDVSGFTEPLDRYCTSTSFDTESIIFQIFDHELDGFGGNPDLQAFVTAWAIRGYDLPAALATWGLAAVGLSLPASIDWYDPQPTADWAVWRSQTGMWYMLWKNLGWVGQQWGQTGDVPLPRDYDGDGKTDVAIWRPSDGNYYVMPSRSGGFWHKTPFAVGDVPLPADYDNDSEVDFAVYRSTLNGGSVIIQGDNCLGDTTVIVGAGTPVVGKFDNNSSTDVGVYNPTTRTFTIKLNASLSVSATMSISGTPVVADYNGDNLTDYAVFDEYSGTWDIKYNGGPETTTGWGAPHGNWRRLTYAIPVPADYDADLKTDLAVWYPDDGMWWVKRAKDDAVTSQQWGQFGDIPIPAR